jgi:hypothetical protein
VGMLTSYAMVKELPKENNKYDETRVVLEDQLCPNGPIEEASVRWVPEPAAAELVHIWEERKERPTRIHPLSRADDLGLSCTLPHGRSLLRPGS